MITIRNVLPRAYLALFAAVTLFATASAQADSASTIAGPTQLAMNDTPAQQDAAKPASLYVRLGGYDAIAAVVDDLVQRLAHDPRLGRFWANRGADGIRREKQLVVNFIVDRAGGPLFYSGRDMVTAHQGMRISEADWKSFMTHLHATLEKFKVPAQEQSDVTGFMESLKTTMVER